MISTLHRQFLQNLWGSAQALRAGAVPTDPGRFHREQLITHTLGLGAEQLSQYLMQEVPSFEAFVDWAVATAGQPGNDRLERLQAALAGVDPPPEARRQLQAIDAMPAVLSDEDLAHWREHGWVTLHDAVPAQARLAAEQAIWEFLGARADDPDSWYRRNDRGIMVQLFQHPAFEANRRSARIHKAFAQLWGTADLWPTTDRGGFNVPQRPGWMYRGSPLHWDTSLAQPIPFETQGILYLTDTPANQGAFTCVPGFHRRIDRWLDSLPAGADPREQDLQALGAVPIAGRAGDLIIWDSRLPHGASPNDADRPRIVQYINMRPAHVARNPAWR